MLISIIIVNWNTKDLITKCLETIEANAASINKEIIVVDNASTDNSTDRIKERFPYVKLVENSENSGYAEGNNIGLKLASGDYILLLNPDTEIQPGAIEELIACINRNPDTAAAAAKLIYPDGSSQRSCRGFPHPWSLVFDYLQISRLFPSSKRLSAYRMLWFDYESEIEVDQPMASCMMVVKKAFDDIGGFDPLFPIFFNDVDWCYRCKLKGWKIFYTPNAKVIHHVGGSTRQVKEAMIRESHISLKKYYEKHYKKSISPILYAIIMTAISLNMVISLRMKRIVGK